MIDHCLPGLRPAREAARIEACDCASAIGVSTTSYHRYENGTRRLYFDKACVLADLFGCSLDALRHVREEATAPADPADGIVDAVLGDWSSPEDTL